MTILVTIVERTSMEATVWNQSVFQSSVGGYRDKTISGVLFKVEKYPATAIKTYRQNTRRMDLRMIFISLYFTGLTSSW